MTESESTEGRTVADMHAEIAATPGSIAHRSIEIIQRCLYVFVGNAMELKAHLESLRDPAVALPVMSQGAEHEAAGDAFDRELLRRFHNFASSVATLVDLTRTIINKMYPVGELREEYDQRTEPFKTNPRRRLVRQLRNYVLHHRLPPTVENLSFTREADGFVMASSITLDHEVLLAHGKWDDHVVELLRSGTALDLLELVDEYLDEVAKLYLWLHDAQVREHRAEIDATNALIEQFKREIGQPPEWDR
jgi:hypothetical protein